MTKHLHLVFSDPPAHVPDDEYNRWYDAHVQEILAVDGWAAATRYRVEGVVAPEHTDAYRFVSAYELDVTPEVALANLEAAGLGSGDSYVELKDVADGSDPLPLPEWFADIRFASMNGTATGPRITPERPRPRRPSSVDRPLAGQVAIVTGAARGIGKAVSIELAREGASVVVAGRSETASDEWPGSIHATVDEIRGEGGTALAARADVNEDDDIERLVATAVDEFGRLDLLVNNAALMGTGTPFLDGDVGYLERAWHANVRAPYVASLAAAKVMVAGGRGVIVNISSGAGRHPLPVRRGGTAPVHERDRDATVYALTKVALDRMSTGMAHELQHDGIAVVAVHPGFIVTERVKTRPRDYRDLSLGAPMSQPALVVAHIARDPMRYTGEIVKAGDFVVEHGIALT